LEKAVDRATVAVCAEMVGGMEASLQMSVAYSKERVQFGKPIGSFQALKHKAANMYVAIETAKSAVYYAAMALDDNMKDARAAISTAKALCSDAYVKVTKDAIQIYGGIGYTDEADIHLYYKRALATNVTFGDADYHRDRYAAEKGF
jgi:alkylation response protein AidB-like acyl-CoA dehydrogenase